MFATFYSCKQEDVQVDSKSEAQKINTSQSAIEQAEEAIGQQLFKKEIDFSDLSGQNIVKFRFAGFDESSIDNYLGQYDISIKPITEDEKRQILARKSSNSANKPNNQENRTETTFSGVAVDFVSKKLYRFCSVVIVLDTVSKNDKSFLLCKVFLVLTSLF